MEELKDMGFFCGDEDTLKLTGFVAAHVCDCMKSH